MIKSTIQIALVMTSLGLVLEGHLLQETSKSTKRPIIGVVSLDLPGHSDKTWISATYVKFLEQAGARVVPVRANQSIDYYNRIVDYTNGMLLPGGALNLETSQYARTARLIWNRAMQLNKAGDYYPIWGICMGFQMLCVLTAKVNLLKATDSSNASWPIDFTPDAASSRLFGHAPSEILQWLSKENVTQNEHNYSILTQIFDQSVLSKFFTKLSTNLDRHGTQFISTVEGRHYPVYGSQWHPEKNSFNWNPHYVINHDDHAVKVGQYIADFFLSEARKNDHRFPNVTSEIDHMIQNYPIVFSKSDTFEDIYYIDM